MITMNIAIYSGYVPSSWTLPSKQTMKIT